jgi:protein-S-isoprenylcysteine O-methyltransferase Ste14
MCSVRSLFCKFSRHPIYILVWCSWIGQSNASTLFKKEEKTKISTVWFTSSRFWINFFTIHFIILWFILILMNMLNQFMISTTSMNLLFPIRCVHDSKIYFLFTIKIHEVTLVQCYCGNSIHPNKNNTWRAYRQASTESCC